MTDQKKPFWTSKRLGWLMVLVMLILIWLGNFTWKVGTCALYGYQTDRTVKYAVGVGCMVKKDSGWTPKAELRTEQ